MGTGTDPLAISTIAAAGKRPMRAADWARGAGLAEDAAFTQQPKDQKDQKDGVQA